MTNHYNLHPFTLPLLVITVINTALMVNSCNYKEFDKEYSRLRESYEQQFREAKIEKIVIDDSNVFTLDHLSRKNYFISSDGKNYLPKQEQNKQ